MAAGPTNLRSSHGPSNKFLYLVSSFSVAVSLRKARLAHVWNSIIGGGKFGLGDCFFGKCRWWRIVNCKCLHSGNNNRVATNSPERDRTYWWRHMHLPQVRIWRCSYLRKGKFYGYIPQQVETRVFKSCTKKI